MKSGDVAKIATLHTILISHLNYIRYCFVF